MKNYNHKKIESKWQKTWEKKGIYNASNNSKKKKFYGLIEFPYPSGAGLHVGHIRSNTAMDIISRKRRMEGKNVLYPIGWDAFGLPTENYAIKTGIQPAAVTTQNTNIFRKQLKALGFSFDWSREINTTDPKYYRWTQWIFLQFFKQGLAYKAKAFINWCPKDKIGLANEEVIDGRCERCGTPTEKREKEQWMLAITKYADRLDKDLDLVDYPERVKLSQRNWIGKSEGSEIEFKIRGSRSSADLKRKILIGTRNQAKFRMIKECMPSLPGIEFVSLNDIPAVDDSSLVEGNDHILNARMKAEFYFNKTGLPTVSADNILWVEKWKKDKGLIIHMRKEANPKSDRATDEEVISFFQSWLKKVGGRSKAHFIYAISFASHAGTQSFESKQREYILQGKQSKNFWEGYPVESLLIDSRTGKYKGDQENKERYGNLIADLKKHAGGWFKKEPLSVKIFTTRADTIFSAFAVILAPEHPLVAELKSNIKNWPKVEKYIDAVKKKTEIERTAEDKEKTGIELKGIKAVNPANNEEIPVWIADFVLVQYGTGAIFADMHDERDFQFAKKYGLPMKRSLEPLFVTDTGDGAVRKDLPFVKRNAVCAVVVNPKNGKYLCVSWKKFLMHGFVTGGVEEGEDIVETAKREIREETGYKNVKLLRDPNIAIQTMFYHRVKQENRWARFQYLFFELENEQQDPIDKKESDLHDILWKSKDELQGFFSVAEGKFVMNIIEGREYVHTGEGILVNSGKFNGMKSEDARKKITEFVKGKTVTKFKLRDWIFSRQRYWGEPIPIVNCENCGLVPLPDKELPLKLPKVKSYVPTDTGESPLAAITKWVNTKCPKCGGSAKRETDTMPNWAGSSWYYLRYTDPKNTKEFASKKNLLYWLASPRRSSKSEGGVNWYNGGMEHTTLHLLYSRFWHKFLYDLKLVPTVEPYQKRTSHGMILGEGGVKMSKSLGNVINPDDIIKTYGADTLRVYEMFMGPFEDAVAWSTESIIGSRRFIEKVWRVGEKVLSLSDPYPASPLVRGRSKEGAKNSSATPLVKSLHKTIKKVSEDIESMRFNTAISAMMILATEMESAFARGYSVTKENYKLFLQILAPFAPHVTEELFHLLKAKNYKLEADSVHLSQWPKWEEKLIVDDEVKIALSVNGKVRAEMTISADESEEEVKQKALQEENILKYTAGKTPKKIIYVKNRLINIVI